MPPNNILPIHGNEKTMNLNTMILTNIQASPYFKVQLYELKTYHQVIDEIYTRVTHLEPWEKGSRKTAGQTGMCGGVRGVGAGGIVSSCFCLLYKLYTLKLTRKQLVGLMTHTDSPYIRGIGFMYARFTQPPGDLWDWFEPYLDDEEEIDVKAGGGHVMTVGEMVNHFLTKLEWYSTLFPRIPVPIQKQIEQNVLARKHAKAKLQPVVKPPVGPASQPEVLDRDRERERERDADQPYSREKRDLPFDSREVDRIYGRTAPERDDMRRSTPNRDREHHGSRSRGDEIDRDRRRSRSPGHHRSSHHHRSEREQERDKHMARSSDKHSKHAERKRSAERERDSRHADRRSRSRSHHRSRSRSRDKHRSKKHSSHAHHQKSDEYQQDLHKELERIRKSKSYDQNGR